MMLQFFLPENNRARTRAGLTGLCALVALSAAACSSTVGGGGGGGGGNGSANAGMRTTSTTNTTSVTASPSPRGSAASGAIRITGAYLPQPATADVAAAYFTITDTGDEADVLVSATATPAAQTALMRESTNDGAESMTAVTGGLPIPAHGQVTLAPGGYHLMLTNPAASLKQGDIVTLSLRFEHAGTVAIKVPVTSLLSGAMTGSTSAGSATSMPGMPSMPGM
jgi:copper(I)-binding protein